MPAGGPRVSATADTRTGRGAWTHGAEKQRGRGFPGQGHADGQRATKPSRADSRAEEAHCGAHWGTALEPCLSAGVLSCLRLEVSPPPGPWWGVRPARACGGAWPLPKDLLGGEWDPSEGLPAASLGGQTGRGFPRQRTGDGMSALCRGPSGPWLSSAWTLAPGAATGGHPHPGGWVRPTPRLYGPKRVPSPS